MYVPIIVTRVLNSDVIDVQFNKDNSVMYVNGRFTGSIPASGSVERDFGLLMIGVYDE